MILTTILVLCGRLFGPPDSDGSAVLSIVSMQAVTVSTPTITSQGWLAQPLPIPPNMLSNISMGSAKTTKHRHT